MSIPFRKWVPLLPAAGVLSGTELIPGVQGGISVSFNPTTVLGFTQEGTGAITRTVQAKLLGYMITPEDFGAIGNGVADDTVAFQAALNAVAAGQSLYCRGKYLIGNVTVPAGVALIGDFTNPWQKVSDNNYYTFASQLQLKASSTITMGNGSSLSNLLIILTGLSLPCTTNANCTTLLTQFAGTAITATGVYVALKSLLILGFAIGVLANAASSQGSLDCVDVAFDCTNGIEYISGGANGRWHRCYAWPFLTGGVSGVSNANLNRAGTAFFLQGTSGSGHDDWTTLVDCFAYGYAFAFEVVDGSNIKFIGCQADGTGAGTYGFLFTTASGGGNQFPRMLGCTVISHPNAVVMTNTGGSGSGVGMVEGCLFAGASGNAIEVSAGALIAIGNFFNACATGIKFDSGVGPSVVSGNMITGGGTFLSIASGVHVAVRDNPGYNPVGTTAAASVGTSPATITAGPSPETHYLNQAATNTATVTKGSQQIHTLVNASSYYVIEVGPNESYVVTWSTTQPTYTKDVH